MSAAGHRLKLMDQAAVLRDIIDFHHPAVTGDDGGYVRRDFQQKELTGQPYGRETCQQLFDLEDGTM